MIIDLSMRSTVSCVAALALGFHLSLSLGCSNAPKPPPLERPEVSLVPVKGKITVDGQPLTRGVVFFSPESTESSDSSESRPLDVRGIIGEDGTYELMYQPNQPGAPKGTYKVWINLRAKFNPKSKGDNDFIRFRSDHGSLAQTPLIVEVKDTAAPGAYDFNLPREEN